MTSRFSRLFTSSLDEFGKKKPKIWLTLLAGAFTLAGWPSIAAYRSFVLVEPYTYPLVIAMFTCVFILLPGSYWVVSRRDCVCVEKPDEREYEPPPPPLAPGQEPLRPERSPTPSKITCWGWTKRFLHWGFFCGLFLSLFVFTQIYADGMCQKSSNICTLFFRADLFLILLIFLGIIKASRRGKRIDWLVAVLMGCGISLFTWDKSQKFILNFEDDIRLLSTVVLGAVSFALFAISIRRATMHSGVFKTILVTAFYTFILSLVGTILHEGAAPWNAISTIGFYIVWKLIVLTLILVVWFWAVVATFMYSETIVPALALQFSLFLGDFGIHEYFVTSLQWTPMLICGTPMLIIGFLWLMKRATTLHCPNTLTCIKGKCGCIEEDIWDEEQASLLPRDDEEQVPLHNDRSVEDLYTAPGNKKTGGRTGLGAISNEPAPAERSGLSGNSMGNYNPEASNPSPKKTNYGSLSGNLGSYQPQQPTRTSSSNPSSYQNNAPPSRANSLSGYMGSYEPISSKPPELPPRPHQAATSTSSNQSSMSGNWMGNYQPEPHVGLDDDDASASQVDSTEGKKKKKKVLSKLFKKKK